jgi:hypothetical protein
VTDLVHWETVTIYGDRHSRYGIVEAWCYSYYKAPLLTTDPFKVTCGKCQRSKVVKAAAAASF